MIIKKNINLNHGLILFYGLLLLLAISGCKKFLNVRPDDSDSLNPRTVTDFEEMLNSATLASPDYLLADLVGDDLALSDKVLKAGDKSSFYVNAYLWADKVWTPSDDDYTYNFSYKCILQMNIILDNINKAQDGNQERKDIVAAQAKINRAYYYLQLVNLYGMDYQSASADKDLAIPLVLHADANAKPDRSTVKQVYDQILKDLNEAVSTISLPDFGIDVIHPGKASAIAVLARTYLYMGDYEHALAAAEQALKIRNKLMDYKAAGTKPISLKDQEKNPEILFARVGINIDFYKKFTETPYISEELRLLIGSTDLRLKNAFVLKSGDTRFSYPTYKVDNGTSMAFNYSIGVPEMMLIQAECLARKNEPAAALNLLNQLRVSRFPAGYTPLDASVGTDDVLAWVLQERRRELFMRGGLSLFDLKRLNREALFKKDLERKSLTDGSTKASLQAGSPRYLIPFAPKIIANNPLIIQNQR